MLPSYSLRQLLAPAVEQPRVHEPVVVLGPVHVPQRFELAPAPAELLQPGTSIGHDLVAAPRDAIEERRVCPRQSDQGVTAVLARYEYRIVALAQRPLSLPQVAGGEGRTVRSDQERRSVVDQRVFQRNPHALAEIARGLLVEGNAVVSRAEPEEWIVGAGGAVQLRAFEGGGAQGVECAPDKLNVERRGGFFTQQRDEARLDRAGPRCFGEYDDGGAVTICHSAGRALRGRRRASRPASGATSGRWCAARRAS